MCALYIWMFRYIMAASYLLHFFLGYSHVQFATRGLGWLLMLAYVALAYVRTLYHGVS